MCVCVYAYVYVCIFEEPAVLLPCAHRGCAFAPRSPGAATGGPRLCTSAPLPPGKNLEGGGFVDTRHDQHSEIEFSKTC